jgi:hypothetical protein
MKAKQSIELLMDFSHMPPYFFCDIFAMKNWLIDYYRHEFIFDQWEHS